MTEKELKTKVDEYFEKYMCVSFDKFLENFNESVEWCRYKDKEIERLNNIIKNLDKMFEYYFLGNLKYDQDTVNTIYIKYVKLKEFEEGK